MKEIMCLRVMDLIWRILLGFQIDLLSGEADFRETGCIPCPLDGGAAAFSQRGGVVVFLRWCDPDHELCSSVKPARIVGRKRTQASWNPLLRSNVVGSTELEIQQEAPVTIAGVVSLNLVQNISRSET